MRSIGNLCSREKSLLHSSELVMGFDRCLDLNGLPKMSSVILRGREPSEEVAFIVLKLMSHGEL